MERRLRHSVAVDPRERAEMNALLVATDQKDASRVRDDRRRREPGRGGG
jgi:hypothetical protein